MHGGRVLEGVEVPALGGHGVGDVVDVEVAGGEGDDGDKRAADDLELGRQGRRCRRDVLGDLLGAAYNLHAGVYVARLAHAHHRRPAAGDEGARTRPGDARRRIHAAAPVGGHKVLVGAQFLCAVQDRRIALGGEAVLVRVATDGCYTLEAEVERLCLEAGLFEERNQERSQTAVDVKGNAALHGKLGESRDVVDDAVGEVGGRAHQENCVAIDKAGDSVDVNLVGGCGACDKMDLDLEILSRLVEGRVGRF